MTHSRVETMFWRGELTPRGKWALEPTTLHFNNSDEFGVQLEKMGKMREHSAELTAQGIPWKIVRKTTVTEILDEDVEAFA